MPAGFTITPISPENSAVVSVIRRAHIRLRMDGPVTLAVRSDADELTLSAHDPESFLI